MTQADTLRRIEAVRAFSRFYTRRIGVLHEGLLGSPFSLTESRVIYELAHQENVTAGDLARQLGLDPGYLSRILKGFEGQGLLERRASESDGRRQVLSLTEKGQAGFARINARSRSEIGDMLGTLSKTEQGRLVESMAEIESLLGDGPPRHAPYILRPHQAGDMGWVIQRHGQIYAEEFGWDETFEAMVAEIAAAFIKNYEPKRERCWIAERHGENVGSVFIVRQSEGVAKLRMLLVERHVRGLGIGRRLVEEALVFARQRGYRKVTLWTVEGLEAARRLYEQAGFQLARKEPFEGFGRPMTAQTWELKL